MQLDWGVAAISLYYSSLCGNCPHVSDREISTINVCLSTFKQKSHQLKQKEGYHLRLIKTYEDSPRGAASAGTTCLFLGWLLMSLLSFYHVQSGWNFNMLVSKLAGVNWLWHLWYLARFRAAQILAIDFAYWLYWQNLWSTFERP